MAHTEDHGPQLADLAGVKHQKSDISISVVIKFLAVLFVATAFVDVLIVGVMKVLEYQRAQSEVPPPALFVTEQQQYPPEPRLQGEPGSSYQLQDPALEVKAFDKQQEDELKSYGWVDRGKGEVRIPIADAMKLVLQRGLPTQAPAAGQPQPGIQMPTGSSAGREAEPRKE